MSGPEPRWVFCARCHMAIAWNGEQWVRTATTVPDRVACGMGAHEPARPGQ